MIIAIGTDILEIRRLEQSVGRSGEAFLRRFLTEDHLDDSLHTAATAQKCRDKLMRAALETAAEIRSLHFSLEERYVSTMDFDTMRARTDAWIQKILP